MSGWQRPVTSRPRSPRRSPPARPVVALETTLVTHGLPHPRGSRRRASSSDAVRARGARAGDDRRSSTGTVRVGLARGGAGAAGGRARRRQGQPGQLRGRGGRGRPRLDHRGGDDVRRRAGGHPRLRHRAASAACTATPPRAATRRPTSRRSRASRWRWCAPGRRRSSTCRGRSRCWRRSACRCSASARRVPGVLPALERPARGPPLRLGGRAGPGGPHPLGPRHSPRACVVANPVPEADELPRGRDDSALGAALAEAADVAAAA